MYHASIVLKAPFYVLELQEKIRYQVSSLLRLTCLVDETDIIDNV